MAPKFMANWRARGRADCLRWKPAYDRNGSLVVFEIVERAVIGFNPLEVLYGGLGVLSLGACAPYCLTRVRG